MTNPIHTTKAQDIQERIKDLQSALRSHSKSRRKNPSDKQFVADLAYIEEQLDDLVMTIAVAADES